MKHRPQPKVARPPLILMALAVFLIAFGATHAQQVASTTAGKPTTAAEGGGEAQAAAVNDEGTAIVHPQDEDSVGGSRPIREEKSQDRDPLPNPTPDDEDANAAAVTDNSADAEEDVEHGPVNAMDGAMDGLDKDTAAVGGGGGRYQKTAFNVKGGDVDGRQDTGPVGDGGAASSGGGWQTGGISGGGGAWRSPSSSSGAHGATRQHGSGDGNVREDEGSNNNTAERGPPATTTTADNKMDKIWGGCGAASKASLSSSSSGVPKGTAAAAAATGSSASKLKTATSSHPSHGATMQSAAAGAKTKTSPQGGAQKPPYVPKVGHHPNAHVIHQHKDGVAALPPEGYPVTAAIYTNPHDGLSYFWTGEATSDGGGGVSNDSSKSDDASSPAGADSARSGSGGSSSAPDGAAASGHHHPPQQQQQLPHIPFLECNAIGSTTAPLPFKSGSFRHFPCGADPASFTVTPHPGQLAICLSKIEITVSGNDEETRIFHEGDVILLEDTMGRGHKMRACCGRKECGPPSSVAAGAGEPSLATDAPPVMHEHEDMKVLLLTLSHPTHYHHHHHHHDQQGRRQHQNESSSPKGRGWSIFKPFPGTSSPCKTESDPSFSSYGGAGGDPLQVSIYDSPTSPAAFFGSNRRRILGGIGAGLSMGAAYWLSQVAPYVLAIGGGGVCLVAGGTCAFVVQGERLMDRLEELYWNVRYRSQTSSRMSEGSSNDEGEGDDEEDQEGPAGHMSQPTNKPNNTGPPPLTMDDEEVVAGYALRESDDEYMEM